MDILWPSNAYDLVDNYICRVVRFEHASGGMMSVRVFDRLSLGALEQFCQQRYR